MEKKQILSLSIFKILFKTGAHDGKGGRPQLVEYGRKGNINFFKK